MKLASIVVGTIIGSYLAIIILSVIFPAFYQWLVSTGKYGYWMLFGSIVLLLFLLPILGFCPERQEIQE